jgi:hypothetical protein
MTDREILKIAREMRSGLLENTKPAGMCFVVSAALGGYLSMLGLDCRLIKRDFGFTNHVWLELPDGRVLDPTADQFNKRLRNKFPKIYLGELPKIYRRWSSPQIGAEHE